MPYRPEYLGVKATINAYPEQIGRVLKALGPINEGDECFVPALPGHQRSRQGNLIPQSEHVTFSNLRDTVVALANPATNPQVCETFYVHNSIPGAICEVGSARPPPDGGQNLARRDPLRQGLKRALFQKFFKRSRMA
jgi:hypothetical protein